MGGIPYRGKETEAREAGGAGAGDGLRAWFRAKGKKTAGILLLLLLAGGYAAWRGLSDGGAGDALVLGAERTDAEASGAPGSAETAKGAAAADATGGATVAASPTPAVETIRVQIVGAVNRPGVYGIPKGSCLETLVALAGGFTEAADAERINLVWRIDRSLLVRIGEKAAPSGGAGAVGGATGTAGAGAAVQVTDQPSLSSVDGSDPDAAGPIDLNAATAAQLDALPGIGPTTAAAIVAYREKNGPFAKKEDLMKVSGIKQSRYDAVKDLVSVG